MNLSEMTLDQLEALKHKLTLKHIDLNNTQTALKLNANSCYGALGAPSCMWFNKDIAEAVTISGQYTIKNVSKKLDDYLSKILGKQQNFVVYNDTDSSYLALNSIMEKFLPNGTHDEKHTFLDKICADKLNAIIKKTFEQQAVDMNCVKSRLSMKRENLADKAIFVKSKNYILNVINKEGGIRLDKPKLKTVGLDSVRTSTPILCRKRIPELVDLIFSADQSAVIEFIENFRAEFEQAPLSQIGKPIGANNFDDYTDDEGNGIKGITQQLRASLNFNNMLKTCKVEDQYAPILEGDKVKVLFLKRANPTFQNVIAFKDELPDEFNLKMYVDYDTQFLKSFLNPVKRILDPIGWHTKEISTLDSLFD